MYEPVPGEPAQITVMVEPFWASCGTETGTTTRPMAFGLSLSKYGNIPASLKEIDDDVVPIAISPVSKKAPFPRLVAEWFVVPVFCHLTLSDWSDVRTAVGS